MIYFGQASWSTGFDKFTILTFLIFFYKARKLESVCKRMSLKFGNI